jgi:hypothetical protein
MTRLRREQKEEDLCFVVYEKKGRCFLPSAQKIQVSSTSKQFIHGCRAHGSALNKNKAFAPKNSKIRNIWLFTGEEFI